MARPANYRKYDFSSEAPQVAAEVISELFSQQSRQKRGGGEREREKMSFSWKSWNVRAPAREKN